MANYDFSQVTGVKDSLVVHSSSGKKILCLEVENAGEELSKQVDEKFNSEIADDYLFKYRFVRDEAGEIDQEKLLWSVDWHLGNDREEKLISTTKLQLSDSFGSRMMAYLNERYNPGVFLFTMILVVFTLFRGVQGLENFEWSGDIYLAAGIMIIMQWFFYLLLRVFDEHKDWDTDHRFFPERILSQGLIDLSDLRKAGVLSTVIVFGLAFYIGLDMVIHSIIVFIYALLMLKEFFIADWLKERMFLYGISHNFIIFLVMHWGILACYMALGKDLDYGDLKIHMLALSMNAFFFSLEVARKVRLPQYEKPEVDTYSQVIGMKNTVLLAIFVQAFSFACFYFSGVPVGVIAWSVMIGVFLIVSVGASIKLLKKPEKVAAEKLVDPFSLTFIVFMATVIAAV